MSLDRYKEKLHLKNEIDLEFMASPNTLENCKPSVFKYAYQSINAYKSVYYPSFWN
ncbi:MAG: hypothetical protein PHI65_04650 [Firmicutes bacterium]|nr:hypothetical protein [Bacillota bacterium]